MISQNQKIPLGWQEINLDQIADDRKFSIVDGPFGTQLHAEEYQEEGVPVVRVVNLSYEGKFLGGNTVFISEKKALQLQRSKVVPEDIIVAKTGATIGKSGMFPDSYKSGIVASSCMKITCDEDKAVPKLILYLISWQRGQKKIIDGATGSTRTTINIAPFANIKFLLPKLIQEQSKIAEILSTIDEAIDKTESLIQKYQRIKQGLMQDLLTKGIDENGNIRDEKTHKFKNSPLGRMPQEWEVIKLGGKRMTEIITKGTTPTTYGYNFASEGVNFIKVESINESGEFVKEQFQYINTETNEYLKRSQLKEKDILFSIAGALGRVALVPSNLLPANINQALAVIRLRDKENAQFIKFYLETEIIRHQINKVNVQLAQANLSLEQIGELWVSLPNKEERVKIVFILSHVNDLIDREKGYKQKLLALKRGLMEDLLTGTVRVNHLIGKN